MRCFNDLPARELALPGPLVEFMAFAFAVRFKQGSGSWGDVMLVHCNPVRATQLGWTKHLEQRRPLTGDFTRPARPASLRPRNLPPELGPWNLPPVPQVFVLRFTISIRGRSGRTGLPRQPVSGQR